MDRLCTEHLAYVWLVGGVSMIYDTPEHLPGAAAAALEGLFVR